MQASPRGITMKTILVVDDEPMNHEFVHAYLEGEGYRLVDAMSGAEALAIAQQDPPDLVLLDVMMPGFDGFEVARALKEQAAGHYLPIILVTALADHNSLLAGLNTHADEVLTKPVDGQELVLRIRHLLMLRSQHVSLLQKNVELAELHRFKDEMSSLIVHDLKNPLGAIITNLSFVLGEPGNLDADQLDALSDAQSASQRAMRLIQNLLDVTRIEASRFEPRRASTGIAALIDGALQQRTIVARSRGISMVSTLDASLQVDIDGDLITRAIENILDNRLRYTPRGGRIQISGEVVGSNLELRIGNTGPAVDAAARTLVFEKFGQASQSSGRMNLGLGLYFCRLAVEAHGGRIWLGDAPELPTVFNITLPMRHLAH
ncbi:MAG: hypothetical protein DI536_05165 [Archangium gephyra]|uniref:histidine kinase n=1 Tax=Archangium gephyra TaxID=48 RepID=A0A2W5V5D5_9BACT|nr:MAG: hypothetical protein DI536_05165 [Archangium gephyra]